MNEQAQVKIQCYMPVIVQIARGHYYSTIRRHRSIFGVHTQALAGPRVEGLGISCNTREATFAGGLTICLWPVGFVCGSV